MSHPIRAALDRSGPRPPVDAERADKKNYAERLSRELAVVFGRALRAEFPSKLVVPDGSDARRGKLDAAVLDDFDGLRVSVSIKTYSFRDWDSQARKARRYSKNMVRNDHELCAEAQEIHRRQPYAALTAVMFIPSDACGDGGPGPSSFAAAARTFRERTGRLRGDDPRSELFDSFFLALYEPDGPERGAVRFFDVAMAPPKQGRPKVTQSFAEVMATIRSLHDARNQELARLDDLERRTRSSSRIHSTA